jgi:UDP-3-O-[3-hydroxymyristoyl] glucosamine N-acyltransferase
MPAAPVSLGELATLVGGELGGRADVPIHGVAPLDQAGVNEISFLANPKYRRQLELTGAAAVIVHPSLNGVIDRPLLLHKNPYLAFARILAYFHPAPVLPQGISPGAIVDPSAVVAPCATVSPGCVVGAGVRIAAGVVLHPRVVVYPEVEIGEGSVIHTGVVIRERCVIGRRVIVQPNAVIGSDGFGFAPDGAGYLKVPQVGRVIVEDDVEIGACTCIDRGTLGDTLIGSGTKLDNQVQIGHNVRIGENCILVAQVGISGSTEIGKHCTFGGQAGTAGHIKIGDFVTIAGRGGVSGDVASNQVMAGFPLQPHRDWLKMAMVMTHLPEIRKELKQLRKDLQSLENKRTEEPD